MAEEMPRVDMSKEFHKLNPSEQHYIRRLESMNSTRSATNTSMKFRNRMTGALLGLGVLGVYIYTIATVKQEKFIDEIDEAIAKKKQEAKS